MKTPTGFKSGIAIPALLCLATLSSSAQDFTILHSFGATPDGCHPAGGLVQGPDGTLYGTTQRGGAFNDGTVFKINANGTAYAVLHSFSGPEGSNPEASLVLSGTTLYGTAPSTYWYPGGGMVFKLNVDGSNFAVIKQFNANTDEKTPTGGLVLSGTTLYGTTRGGAAGNGAVFKVNTDGSDYVVLKTFSGTDGSGPRATLLLDGGTLYGTTDGGGSPAGNNFGTVFKVNTDGSGFAQLRSFSGTDGDVAWGGLTLSGATLYGTTVMGGDVPGGASDGSGTVFKINTDGSGFALLKTFFQMNEGAYPYAGLLLAGQKLIGTTDFTSTTFDYLGEGCGTIFGMNTDGTGFTVLKIFSGNDGTYPRSGLVLAGRTLFGTTLYGGHANNGVVFALTLSPPAIDRSPASQTAELGSNLRLSALAHGSTPLIYHWYFNETNFLCASSDGLLQLNNVRASDAGAYRVVATNFTGAATSSVATLSVIAPVPRRIVPALTLQSQTGTLLNLDSSTNPGPSAAWEALGTVSLTSASQYYFAVNTPLVPRQFFRAWHTNALSPSPRLDLHLVPAITLTGIVGDRLRLDCINQFGPTDAWWTLDTVTLTNTSQLYFDTSSIGQPARLWRIVPLAGASDGSRAVSKVTGQ